MNSDFEMEIMFWGFKKKKKTEKPKGLNYMKTTAFKLGEE